VIHASRSLASGVDAFYSRFASVGEAVEALDKTHRLKAQCQYFIEARAETTFQSSLWVDEFVRKHKVRSVLMVTSGY
jgi:hypothetical protein